MGFLREGYLKADGSVGYRCAAEPIDAYVAKGGKLEDTVGRKCICNGLCADVGYGRVLPDGSRDSGIITLGDDYVNIGRFCSMEKLDYTAGEVISKILS